MRARNNDLSLNPQGSLESLDTDPQDPTPLQLRRASNPRKGEQCDKKE